MKAVQYKGRRGVKEKRLEKITLTYCQKGHKIVQKNGSLVIFLNFCLNRKGYKINWLFNYDPFGTEIALY